MQAFVSLGKAKSGPQPTPDLLVFPTLVQVLILDLFEDGDTAQGVLVIFGDLTIGAGAHSSHSRQPQNRLTAESMIERSHSRATPGYDHRRQSFILFLPIPHEVAIKIISPSLCQSSHLTIVEGRKGRSAHLGTATNKVSRYSLSTTTCSLLTIPTKDLVDRFPLRARDDGSKGEFEDQKKMSSEKVWACGDSRLFPLHAC